MNPVRSLQNPYQAKRERRIAASLSVPSASPITGTAYSAGALGFFINRKLLTG